MVAQARLLSLFNLDPIIKANAKKVIGLELFGAVTNKRDLLSLLIYYTLIDIINIYKRNQGFITFYLSTEVQSLLTEDGAILRETKCSKLVRTLTKRIKFPIIVSSLSFEDICKLLNTNCPEYDEILGKYKFMSELLPDIINEAKSLRFYNLAEKLRNDINEQLALLNFE